MRFGRRLPHGGRCRLRLRDERRAARLVPKRRERVNPEDPLALARLGVVEGLGRARESISSQCLLVNLMLEIVVLDDEYLRVVHGSAQSNARAPDKSSFRLDRSRNEDGERASFAGFGLHHQPAAHFLCDLINHG